MGLRHHKFEGLGVVMAALVMGTMLLWTGSGYALPAFSTGLVPGANTISDDSGEIFLDRDGSGTVSVNDRFIGILGVTSMQPSNLIPGTDINELTGVFAFEVLSAGAPSACAGVTLPSGCAAFTFGTPTGGLNAALNELSIDWGPAGGAVDPAAFTGPNGALDPNTVFIAFEDPAPDFDLAQLTIQDVIDSVVNGDVVAALGLDPMQAQNVIGAFAPVAPAEIADVPGGQGIGNISFNLSVSDTSLPLDTTQPVTGTGNISAPFPTNPFIIRNDVTINVIVGEQQPPPIPEPGTLSLLGMGIGLLAFGAVVRRRREGSGV